MAINGHLATGHHFAPITRTQFDKRSKFIPTNAICKVAVKGGVEVVEGGRLQGYIATLQGARPRGAISGRVVKSY